MRGTYSPEDNKLRLYPSHRLDKEDYERFKAAGFSWAPKQGLFVAPMWTPGRFDLLAEFCGDVEDEDTSLTERAEQRADRFEDYKDKRAADANRAHEAVKAIADNIPFGQPILVGHHSEKHARRDAKKIENGMRKAVSMWETSKYWKERAAGVLHHAKYKDKPGVRARRIKTLGAEMRKHERNKERAETFLKLWSKEGLTIEQARLIAGNFDSMLNMPRKEGDDPQFRASAYDVLREEPSKLYAPRTLAEVVEAAKIAYPNTIAHQERWIEHYKNRIAYETALLEEQGAAELIAPKARPKLPPILNYDGEVTLKGMYRNPDETLKMHHMTKAAFNAVYEGSRGTRYSADGSHRVRIAILRLPGGKQYGEMVPVFLTDSKVHEKPAQAAPAQVEPRHEPKPEPSREVWKAPEPTAFDFMKEQLKTGVKVVVADQLFTTPQKLAQRAAELADIEPGHDVLEPSAGTGALLDAFFHLNGTGFNGKPAAGRLVAVEINHALADGLREKYPLADIRQADFLACNGDLGMFDRIIMNPPFSDGDDIRHIIHAAGFLKPGGRLVAICADGPRQNDKLKSLAASWERLPPGTFKESGTNVNTVLLTITN